ncbi:HpcH/HpaI aldolase/citrate lyase family protein [Paraburkholderia antibiotica]|uniref:CoA ester lyase n=1 Tax=Paraburkholderia antibiotica TaxID=2728839 RepID=A0A7X9X6C2_9BURK|nr:CoA ester lyase [Paraburkholderia antibiotica]NML32296.1 CoA ester lyase [Paraburkholderia antibiotica]
MLDLQTTSAPSIGSATEVKPRRCMLLVPATSVALIAKAAATDADIVMIDCDDAVVYEDAAKRLARRVLIDAMRSVDFRGKEVAVRINATDTPWWRGDIEACVEAGIEIIMPPKADTADDLLVVTNFVDTLAGAERLKMWPMIETVGAVLNCEDIARRVPRLSGLCFGIGDYTVSVGSHFVDTPDRVLYPLSKLVCVARYHGLVPLAPAVAFSNMGRDSITEEWGTFLKRLGFEGALVVHPRHVPIINAIFSPSREEIDLALEMQQAITEARAQNRAAVVIGGKLIEKVNIDIAARTLAIAAKLGLVDTLTGACE